MKTLKFFRMDFILLSVAILMAYTSCKKDDVTDETSADYIGVWVTEITYSPEDGGFVLKDVINFSRNSFTEVAKVKDDNSGSWIDIAGRKGTFTVANGKMNISLTEAGMTTTDPLSGGPTGSIMYYKEGTTEFSNILIEMEMTQNYTALYSISDNTMTLKADNNNDGSYDDQDEVNIYTKQQ